MKNFKNTKRNFHKLVPKCEYIPTPAELDYCKQVNVSPQEYIDIKYERHEAFKKNN